MFYILAKLQKYLCWDSNVNIDIKQIQKYTQYKQMPNNKKKEQNLSVPVFPTYILYKTKTPDNEANGGHCQAPVM